MAGVCGYACDPVSITSALHEYMNVFEMCFNIDYIIYLFCEECSTCYFASPLFCLAISSLIALY